MNIVRNIALTSVAVLLISGCSDDSRFVTDSVFENIHQNHRRIYDMMEYSGVTVENIQENKVADDIVELTADVAIKVPSVEYYKFFTHDTDSPCEIDFSDLDGALKETYKNRYEKFSNGIRSGIFYYGEEIKDLHEKNYFSGTFTVKTRFIDGKSNKVDEGEFTWKTHDPFDEKLSLATRNSLGSIGALKENSPEELDRRKVYTEVCERLKDGFAKVKAINDEYKILLNTLHLKEEIKELTTREGQLVTLAKKLSSQARSLAAEMARLKSRKMKLDMELPALREKVEELRRALQSSGYLFKKEQVRMKKDYEACRRELERREKIEELGVAVAEKEAEFKKISEELKALRSRKAEYQQRHTEGNNQLVQLRERLSKAETELGRALDAGERFLGRYALRAEDSPKTVAMGNFRFARKRGGVVVSACSAVFAAITCVWYLLPIPSFLGFFKFLIVIALNLLGGWGILKALQKLHAKEVLAIGTDGLFESSIVLGCVITVLAIFDKTRSWVDPVVLIWLLIHLLIASCRISDVRGFSVTKKVLLCAEALVFSAAVFMVTTVVAMSGILLILIAIGFIVFSHLSLSDSSGSTQPSASPSGTTNNSDSSATKSVTTELRDSDGNYYKGKGSNPDTIYGGDFRDKATYDRGLDGNYYERWGNRVIKG